MIKTTETVASLSMLERVLLLIPAAGGFVFGLGPLLVPVAFAHVAGATGSDPYIYQLAGAATFGYVVPLVLAARGGAWVPARAVVAAVLAFNVASLYACAAAIASGRAMTVVYLILATSLAIAAITTAMLVRHREATAPRPDVGAWFVRFLALATVVSAAVGLAFLLAPAQVGHALGFKATDEFVYRQGAAAVLGYTVLGIFELRSRSWIAIRLPAVMVIVFNGLSFIVSVLALLAGTPPLFPSVVVVVTVGVVAGTLLAASRRGR